MNDTCFILVAPFDIFGRGLYRYTFEGVCRECPDLKLNDGALRVFINTKGRNPHEFSTEFLEFMEYLMNSKDEIAEKSKSAKIRAIHSKVKKIKLSEKIGVKFMQTWEEKIYIREEGKERKLIELIIRKLQKGKTTEAVAEELEENTDYIRKICEAAEAFAPDYDEDRIYEALHEEEYR